MGRGRIVLLTLIGGGSVALTAFAVKYYLSRKVVLRESAASEAITATTTAESIEPTKQPIIADSEDVATDVAADVASVSAPSPAAVVDDLIEAPVEDVENAPEIISVEANESATTPSAFLAESVIAEYSTPAPSAHVRTDSPGLRVKLPPVAPFIAVDPPIIDEDASFSATPPAVSIAFLHSEGASKGTPPTPPSTPMPPSRGDEDVDEFQAVANMDLIQAAIQGRLEAVKPRYISTDSTGGDKEDEDVKDEDEDVAAEEESKDSADAAADEKGESAAVSVSAVKLQPICEESAVSSGVTGSSEITAAFDAAVKSEPAAEEKKPLSPYMRRKRRSIQPEMEEMKIHQEMLQSNSPSPADSPSKETAAAVGSAAVAAEAATSEMTPPPRTPRIRRRSERRSTGEINAAAASTPQASSASPSVSSKGDEDVSLSRDTFGSGSALDSINDYSFMSDADAAPAAEAASEFTAPSASAAPGEVDLLEGIEDVSLDDLLRDISMGESTAALMTTSMLVEVDHPTVGEGRAYGAGDHMAEVDEDLAKHLNMVDELVLDDSFFGGPSNEIDYTKSDSVIDDRRPKDDADGEFDVRVSIGFKEHDVMMTSTDSTSPMTASTDSDLMIASTDSAVMIASAEIDTLATASDASSVLDNAVGGAEASLAAVDPISKTSKPPKRVVRPRKERAPLDGAFGSTKASKDSAEASSPTAKKTSSSSSSTTTSKSPPAKNPRGSMKRTGIPRPGFQP